MRVGVTGGTGFIGQYLIRDYAAEYDFIVPVRNCSSISAHANAMYVESDFSVESLKDIFKECDAVVHLAAITNRDGLKMTDYIPNIVCAVHVFEACKALDITNIIYASSKSVFGGVHSDEVLMLNESDMPNPNNEYGVSKLCVETLAEFYYQTYGLNITICRMGEVCGMDLTRGMLNPFWKVVLNAVLEKKAVPIYGKGIAGRDLVYVKDVARALVIALENGKGGTYHIGSGYLTSNLEIAETFCEVFDDENRIELHLDKEEWGTNLCLGVEKAKKDLGFEVKYDLNGLVEDIKKEYYRC